MLTPAFVWEKGLLVGAHAMQSSHMRAGASGDGGNGLVLCIMPGDMASEWIFLDALWLLSNTAQAQTLGATMIILILFSPVYVTGLVS